MTERLLDVLVIDDSAVVREVMRRVLSNAAGIRAEMAADAILALDKMRRRRPDVILLDLTLPRMDGFEFLEHVMMTDPIPVVVLSGTAPEGSDRALRALDLGAVELVAKPTLNVVSFLHESRESLIETIRSAATIPVRKRGWTYPPKRGLRPPVGIAPPMPELMSPVSGMSKEIVAIGASTGGPEALRIILEGLGEDAPGIVIAQHMPSGFTAALARRLDSVSPLSVREARDGDLILRGQALLCPGDHHIRVRGRPGSFRACLEASPPINRYRPNIDLLFQSVAEVAGPSAVGIVLTGMGSDGVDGLAAMKRAGAWAIAESQESCAVFGMPRHAIEQGIIDRVLAKERISRAIASAFHK